MNKILDLLESDNHKVYTCNDCGKDWETGQEFNSDSDGNPICPYCGSEDVIISDEKDLNESPEEIEILNIKGYEVDVGQDTGTVRITPLNQDINWYKGTSNAQTVEEAIQNSVDILNKSNKYKVVGTHSTKFDGYVFIESPLDVKDLEGKLKDNSKLEPVPIMYVKYESGVVVSICPVISGLEIEKF